MLAEAPHGAIIKEVCVLLEFPGAYPSNQFQLRHNLRYSGAFGKTCTDINELLLAGCL